MWSPSLLFFKIPSMSLSWKETKKTLCWIHAFQMCQEKVGSHNTLHLIVTHQHIQHIEYVTFTHSYIYLPLVFPTRYWLHDTRTMWWERTRISDPNLRWRTKWLARLTERYGLNDTFNTCTAITTPYNTRIATTTPLLTSDHLIDRVDWLIDLSIHRSDTYINTY